MKKIIVIGCPGSGKSYLSKEISNILNIPCFHIDNLYWTKDKQHITREELIDKYQEVFSQDEYVLDGNYISTISERLKNANTVIFLDFSLEDCINGIRKRNNKVRDDIPWIQTETDGDELIDWIRTFEEREKVEIVRMLEEYKGTIITLKNKEEVSNYLEKLKSNAR